jgi:cytochrome c oxidase subunit 1
MTAVAVRRAQPLQESFVRRYVFSLDHKVIGIQYLVTALFMAVVGGALAMLMRIHLGWPGGGVLDPAQYLGAVTMRGTIMVLFFLTLLPIAFGNFLTPLMIGARDMAFPLLNMLSYWTLVPAILVLLSSFFAPTGPAGGGWTAHPPLSAIPQAASGSGLDQTLWLLAMALLCVDVTFLSFLVWGHHMYVSGLRRFSRAPSCRRRSRSAFRSRQFSCV